MVEDFGFRIDATFFREIAEIDVFAVDGLAVPGDFAAVFVDDSEEHANSGGFASAVGPEETVDARFVEFQGDFVDNFFAGERF